MQHIKLPPIINDVVKETRSVSQIVASECNEPYALVTYDLAVAKIAKQVRATEKPLFDNVFIMFGSFHTEVSYISSLGRIIKGSGGPYVLTEVEAVAPGSLNKFLNGKMYNCCSFPLLYMPFIFKLSCRRKSLVMNLRMIIIYS